LQKLPPQLVGQKPTFIVPSAPPHSPTELLPLLLLQYIRGNGFAGAAFSSYGCFWMGWFINGVLKRQKITVGATDENGEILWFILWGVLTFCFFLFTLRKAINLQVVFSTLTLTFFLLAGGVKSESTHHAAGYMGFICAASAIYTAMSDLAQEELGLLLPGMQVWWPKRISTLEYPSAQPDLPV
jgi:uncharacterized protein